MINFEEQMRKAVKEIAAHGEKFAELKPLANNLDELKKVIKAEEMMKQDPKLSLGEKEARALISEAYRHHLAIIRDAEHEANAAYAKLEAARARFEALRSLCSYEKKHMDTFEREPEHEV